MVAINMCRKSPITGEWIYGITRKHVYFNISVFFIVDTSSTLKFAAVVVFIYLFIYLVFCLFIFLFFRFDRYSYLCCRCCHRYCCFVVGIIVAFCMCVVIVVANLMLMFSILVLLCVPYFTANSVNN